MAFYFIDYENVNKDGLQGISGLMESDTIYLFYSDNADTMSFSLHQRINESPAHILFEKVEAKGRNSLDFQLTTYLGYCIASNKKEPYYIVSKDNGYQSVCAFWEKRHVSVTLISELAKAVFQQEKDNLLESIQSIIEDKDETEEIAGYIIKYKTKQGINNALVKKYGSKRGGELYQQIKGLLKGKKGR